MIFFIKAVYSGISIIGSFLQFLVSVSGARSILEVGTFTGCSALMMAEVLPVDGEVITCDFDPYVNGLAQNLTAKSPHGSKINFCLGM